MYLENKNTNLDQEKDTYDEEDSGEQTDTVNDAIVSITTDTTVISSPYKPTITMSTIITGSSTTNSVDQSPTSEEASSPTPHSRAADIIDSTTTDINRSWAEGAYIYPPPPDQFDYYLPLITYTFLAICVLGVCLIIRVCRYSGRFRISNGRTRNNATTNNENSNNGKPNNTDYITVYTSMEETPKCVY